MGRAPYPAWASWLRHRMSEKRISVGELSKNARIREPTIRSYRAGLRRPTSEEKKRALAAVLKTEGETLEEAHAALVAALNNSANPKDFYEMLDSPAASIRTMSHVYPPFSNGRDKFVDRFFERFFRLSAIRREPVADALGFKLKARLDMLYSGQCQVITNLLGTLQRLKLLRFYWMPIRVSIGAVCIRRHHRSLPQIAETLAIPNSRRRIGTLLPILVEGEVGAIHVEQMLGVDTGSLYVDDLDAANLAAQLEKQDRESGRIACTVTDEVTALSIAKYLGKDALLVFPLSTTHAVHTSNLRRELPAHVLGAAISRKDRFLREYMDDAYRAMLLLERETTASNYALLFEELTKHVTDCLDKIGMVADSHGGTINLEKMADRERELYIYRTSRAYARRTLQIDRQSIDMYEHATSPWRNILERTREKSLIGESENRLYVRDRVRLVIREVYGKGSAAKAVIDARNLLPMINQEFDIGLENTEFPTTPTVEKITSAVQFAMERSSTVARLTNVGTVDPKDPEMCVLRNELSREFLQPEELPDRPEDMPEMTSLLAVYRSHYVGCTDICKNVDGIHVLQNLYVRPLFRRNGVGRLLVRSAIERVSASEGSRLLIDLSRIPNDRTSAAIPHYQTGLRFFERNGFVQEQRGALLQYDLL